MRKKKKDRINLIYIASIGRSGTTLFESMLGAHSDIVTAGEVQLWSHEILDGGVLPTGSGQYVQDCAFWQTMRRRVSPLKQPEPQIHYFREKHTAGKTLRLERWREFGTTLPSSPTRSDIDQYGKNNYELFSSFIKLVEEHTGEKPTWVVDASKDPYRLLWLLRSGYFNIKVFQMVKDPRGFVFSVTKRWIREHKNVRRLYYTARQALAWSVRNHLYNKLSKHHIAESDFMLIQYEDLASRPKHVYREACKVIGCEYQPEAVDNFRKGSPFAIAGNPMRHDDRPIELDERWKRDLPYSSQLLAQLITSINKHTFGYE